MFSCCIVSFQIHIIFHDICCFLRLLLRCMCASPRSETAKRVRHGPSQNLYDASLCSLVKCSQLRVRVHFRARNAWLSWRAERMPPHKLFELLLLRCSVGHLFLRRVSIYGATSRFGSHPVHVSELRLRRKTVGAGFPLVAKQECCQSLMSSR
jgi:hypothetical protein